MRQTFNTDILEYVTLEGYTYTYTSSASSSASQVT